MQGNLYKKELKRLPLFVYVDAATPFFSFNIKWDGLKKGKENVMKALCFHCKILVLAGNTAAA